jgi:hypothetical protein
MAAHPTDVRVYLGLERRGNIPTLPLYSISKSNPSTPAVRNGRGYPRLLARS